MMLLNEAYDYNEINRWIIDQAIILNNQFIYNIILIIIGSSSSSSSSSSNSDNYSTLYIIQNVKDYITMTIILSDNYDSIDNHSSGYRDSDRSISSRSSSSSSRSSSSSHLHHNISCNGLYYHTKSWRYMKIYMNAYKKKNYGISNNNSSSSSSSSRSSSSYHPLHNKQQKQQQQEHSQYGNEYHSNYKNNYNNQEVGMIMMNFMKQKKLHISSDIIMI